MDLTKFIKIMNMTTSPNDNEALVALRMANGMLQKHNLTWEKALSKIHSQSGGSGYERTRSSTEYSEFRRSYEQAKAEQRTGAERRHYGKSQEIEKMFSVCMQNVKGQPLGFIHSLYQHYKDWGRLSEKQYNALKVFYQNVYRRGKT